MHPNVDLNYKNLQFCFSSDKQAQLLGGGSQQSSDSWW